MKIQVFISSSSEPESMRIAKHIESALKARDNIEVRFWTDAFPSGEYHLASLLQIAQEVDFAIFVLGRDNKRISVQESEISDESKNSSDISKKGNNEIRDGTEESIPRDNVVLELGIFATALEMSRCFMIVPQSRPRTNYEVGSPKETSNPRRPSVRVPTDLLGINYISYDEDAAKGNGIHDALRACCDNIASSVNRLRGLGRNQFRSLFGASKKAVIVLPDVVAGQVRTRFRHWWPKANENPPATLISLETRVHNLSPSENYRSSWWFGDQRKACGSLSLRTRLTGSENSNSVEPMIHANDQRASNAVSEILAGYGVDILTSTDGSEQDSIMTCSTVCVSIGLVNGSAFAACRTIEAESRGVFSLIPQWSQSSSAEQPSPLQQFSAVLCFESSQYSLKSSRNENEPQYALVGRVMRRHGPGNIAPHFVLGGISSAGTSVAGIYLRYQWQEILLAYERNEFDFSTDGYVAILEYFGDKPENAKPIVKHMCLFQPYGRRIVINV